MPEPKVLVLRTGSASHLVCTEYREDDNGRMHILGANCYGTFNRQHMEVEYRKVSLPVLEIVYEDYNWPSEIPTPASVKDVLQHFGVL